MGWSAKGSNALDKQRLIELASQTANGASPFFVELLLKT
jgi:hypothetical protein